MITNHNLYTVYIFSLGGIQTQNRLKVQIFSISTIMCEDKVLEKRSHIAQVSIHVGASHKASQHLTLISPIQIVRPHAILAGQGG